MYRLAGIIAFIILGTGVAMAQDSLPARDSLRIYKKIQSVAYKHRLTKMAYDAVFVLPKPKEYPVLPEKKEGENVNPYIKSQDKIIRHIEIIVHDPFGYSVTDTVEHAVNTSQRIGNSIHTTTRRWVIINKLLFKENKKLDPLAISETERLLRAAIYVNDARIFVTPTKKGDSVDVTVVVQDKFPIGVPVFVSDVSANIKFQNNNLFGLGQQFEQYAGYRRAGNFTDFHGSYNIANLDNTYISSNLGYDTNPTGTSVTLAFDRPFYSPLARWAGGAAANKNWGYFPYKDTLAQLDKQRTVESFGYDIWGAKSFKLSMDTTIFSQSTNIIVGARHYQNNYQSRPPASIDPGHSYRNTSAYVGNLGFSVQQFYKDKFIYRFGANEDVPEGFLAQLLYGVEKKEGYRLRYFTGFEIARAKHFKELGGYLSATYSYGVFFNSDIANDITMNGKLEFFTDLRKAGRWYLRQFANFNIVHGEHKSYGETVTLSSDELYGFNANNISGNTKMVLNLETVAYAPYNIIGFRIAPVVLIGLGMLGTPQDHLVSSRLYQGYSLGLMLRNENLLSSTFQISFGMYPFIPGGGNYIVKYNPVTSFTLRVRGFSVSEPSFVSYN